MNVKTKMMASETGLGLGATASSIYSNQGLIGFYKGNDANIMRAIVNNGTKMACYDTSKSLVKGYAPSPLTASRSRSTPPAGEQKATTMGKGFLSIYGHSGHKLTFYGAFLTCKDWNSSTSLDARTAFAGP